MIMNNKLNLLILTIVVVLSSLASEAAEPLTVQNFEGEARVAMTTGLGWKKDMRGKIGVGFGLELRQNIRNTPWDAGLMIDLNQACESFTCSDGSRDYLNNRVLSIAAAGDYNLRQGRRINPFAGLGIGVGFYDIPGSNPLNISTHGTAAVFIPRIGVEFAHHIRLTGSFTIVRKGFNSFNLSLGFVIGGRPKKQ